MSPLNLTACRRYRGSCLHFHRGVVASLAGAFVLMAATATAEAQTPLTLPDAQRRAVERSRQLVARDSATTAAREMAVAAAQLPDPVATLGINNLPINGPDAWSLTRDFMTMRSVGVMQELTRAEKRRARAARFEREAEQTLAEKTAGVAAIQRDTALAWLDPSLITAKDTRYLDVDLNRGAGYGNTLSWTEQDKPKIVGPLAEVQVDLNQERFYTMFVDLLTAPTPKP